MKTILIIIFLFIFLNSFSQWTYYSKSDPFDGKYKSAYVIGISDKFPYENPLFVINTFKKDSGNFNIYLSKVPCACCENLEIDIKFDNDDNIYELEGNTNSKKDIWFLKFDNKILHNDDNFENYITFLSDIKIHSKMYIRLKNDCEEYDCEFSLLGSSKAIDFLNKN